MGGSAFTEGRGDAHQQVAAELVVDFFAAANPGRGIGHRRVPLLSCFAAGCYEAGVPRICIYRHRRSAKLNARPKPRRLMHFDLADLRLFIHIAESPA